MRDSAKNAEIQEIKNLAIKQSEVQMEIARYTKNVHFVR